MLKRISNFLRRVKRMKMKKRQARRKKTLTMSQTC
jgi:hypothetical protein